MNKSLQQLKQSHQTLLFLIDAIMVALLISNLSWIIFDWLFQLDLTKQTIEFLSPAFYGFYDTHIHPHFIFYDLIFSCIFLTEFIFRWVVSVKHKEYPRWFLFPLIHFYDLLGCIPAGGFRILRFFRIFSIIYRLHKYQIIDLSRNPLLRQLRRAYSAIMDEITDRVVINVIKGVQQELVEGSPLKRQMIQSALEPRRQQLVTWISQRVRDVTAQTYQRNESKIQRDITTHVSRAIDRNRHVGRMEQVPVVGPMIAEELENTVSEIAVDVVHGLIQDFSLSTGNDVIEHGVNEIISIITTEDAEIDELTREITLDMLEEIKEQVRRKLWTFMEEEPVEPGAIQPAPA